MTAPIGGPPPPTADEPDSMSANERRQRNIVIALGIAGALVLLVGVVAFAATRGGDSSSAPATSESPGTSEATTTTVEATTTTAPSTTSTTSTTLAPIPAVADAGTDLDVDIGAEVTLAALDLAEGTPDEAVRWTQTAGPDVTEGTGSLSGPEPVFVAPPDVTTLAFELEVAGTDGVATDDLVVRVFEDANQLVFVDGERGDDGGDGTRSAPFRTLRAAVAASAGRDIYLRSVGSYDETSGPLELDTLNSVYGGFDANWVRTPDDRTQIDVGGVGLVFQGNASSVLSGVEVIGNSSGGTDEARAVFVASSERFSIVDSRIVAADVGAATTDGPGGVSSGVVADGVGELSIVRSTVNAGRGGPGAPGDAATEGERSAVSGGGSASDARGGSAGVGSEQAPGGGGGRGGNGGVSSENGQPGGGGASGGTSGSRNGSPGDGGAGGSGGAGGDGGGAASDFEFVGSPGAPGSSGGPGLGGGGGGGGYGPFLIGGGGGGGGGGGSDGGAGGEPGFGGGGSIALVVTDVDVLRLVESTIAAALGGPGGPGSDGLGPFESGASGGPGAVGFCDFPLCDASAGGNGGGGGSGGVGGEGGEGGGGAGGPSVGLFTSGTGTVEIVASNVRGGAGGAGADGGSGGRRGNDGLDASGRSGADAVSGLSDTQADQGVGAAGGPSIGWFDAGAATQVFDDAVIEAGPAGPGGSGRTPGDAGTTVDSNV